MSTHAPIHRARVSHKTLMAAKALLDARFSSNQLRTRLSISEATLKTYISYGMPVERDSRGYRWFRGVHVKAWILDYHKQRPRTKLPEGFAYCLHCDAGVQIQDAFVQKTQYGSLISGVCPVCGNKVNRGGGSHD